MVHQFHVPPPLMCSWSTGIDEDNEESSSTSDISKGNASESMVSSGELKMSMAKRVGCVGRGRGHGVVR